MSPTRLTHDRRILMALVLALVVACLSWTAQAAASAATVHSAQPGSAQFGKQDEPAGTGGVQIIKTVCNTDEPDHPTMFSVNQPKAVERPDVNAVYGCARGANATFRLTNVETTGFVDLVTGADGEASANRLAAGAYTLVELSTEASTEFDVVDDKATIVSVTNFSFPPSGTLEVVNQQCPGQAETFITVDWPSFTPPGDPDGTVTQSPGGCQFGKASLSVVDAHGNTIWETTTGPSGLSVITLPPGTYTVMTSDPGAISGTGIIAVGKKTKVIVTYPAAA